jgi:hypothetical protein
MYDRAPDNIRTFSFAVISMTLISKSYSEAVAFHGHSCPGLALGYRAAHYAMDALRAGRSDDEELVCIVENDACGVDAIQLVAGCSLGKGNLIFRDLGKHACTFIDRKYKRAIRLVFAPRASCRADRSKGIRAPPESHGRDSYKRGNCGIQYTPVSSDTKDPHYSGRRPLPDQRNNAGDPGESPDLPLGAVCRVRGDGSRAPGPG